MLCLNVFVITERTRQLVHYDLSSYYLVFLDRKILQFFFILLVPVFKYSIDSFSRSVFFKKKNILLFLFLDLLIFVIHSFFPVDFVVDVSCTMSF